VKNLNTTFFHERLLSFEDGAYDVIYDDVRYLFRKETHLKGKLIKVYAEELGNTNFISLNYYPQTANGLLKPCEMADEKVIDFILHCHLHYGTSNNIICPITFNTI
jgi:hypothetical protein